MNRYDRYISSIAKSFMRISGVQRYDKAKRIAKRFDREIKEVIKRVEKNGIK